MNIPRKKQFDHRNLFLKDIHDLLSGVDTLENLHSGARLGCSRALRQTNGDSEEFHHIGTLSTTALLDS